MECIFAQDSTTRRSAGIPAMMAGILGANAETPSFDDVIESLLSVARKPSRITETDDSMSPQVHALNCLKEIIRSARLMYLGKTEKYLPQCLELAATCMKSEV
jgi:Putative death-receptor fusion protein (DUF2428)